MHRIPRRASCAPFGRSWIEEFEAGATRSLRLRVRYAFIKTYRPVLDDEPFRAFDTIFFWARESRNSLAEVDYLTRLGARVFPIEVKAGKTGRLKSLKSFLQQHECPLGIRFSHLPLSLYDGVLSIPLYAVGQMPRLLDEALAL